MRLFHRLSLKNVFLTVLPSVVGLLPPTLDTPLVPSYRINVLVVLLHHQLLLVEHLQDLLIDSLHNLHILQLLGQILVLLVVAVIDLGP